MENPASNNLKLTCDYIDQIAAPFSADCDLKDGYCVVSKGLLADRVSCFPLGLLHQNSSRGQRAGVSLVSSRLPERRDLCSWWYDILRTTCARIDPEVEYLLAAPGTTCFDAVVRASELFGIRRIEFELPEDGLTDPAGAVAWCRSRIEACRSQTNRNELVTPAILSPQLAHDIDFRSEIDVPMRDIVSFDFADRIVVLHSRKKGTVHRLCQQYLKQPDGKIIMLAQTPNQPKAEQDLIDQGAVPWLLFDDNRPSKIDPEAVSSDVAAREASSQIRLTEFCDDGPVNRPEEWLCHWTRPFRSAWPDQTVNEFLDELILGCQTADRSALAALIRIAQLQKLFASVARKDQQVTVSWTAVPLAEFRERRIFRSHRRRYDFEPYGIAVRKSVLMKLGARPVQYLNGEQLKADEVSPFDQPRFDRTGKIDWSNEKEWRSPGDLDLSQIACCDIQVFVDDETERIKLEGLCSWSTIVVSQNRPTS